MYKQTILPNGLIVASEDMPHLESVSVGVYIRAGARDETAENNGVAHFLEHMAFKGTERRSAQDIAAAIEDIGGDMNAYTSRETTAYHVKVLQEDLALAVDVLGDILQNSTFVSEEMERERGVIMQEYNAMLDSPEEMVFENLQKTAYENQAMGRHILGTADTIRSMTADDLRQFIDTHYYGENMVLAAAGRVDHNALVDVANKVFGSLKSGVSCPQVAAHYTAGQSIVHKDGLEQVQVALSYDGVSINDDLYYAANVWNMALGGGMMSRLFQEVREKRGLAYSVCSFMSNFMDCGNLGVYAGTDRAHTEELLDVLRSEVQAATKSVDITAAKRAKTQLVASVRMAQESSDARMSRIARNLFIENRFIPIEEIVEEVGKVNEESLYAAAQKMTDPKTEVLSVYGPVKGLSI